MVPIRAIGRPPARVANTTASSWSTRWCCAAPRSRRRKTMRASATAISSIRPPVGSSPDCAWPSFRRERPSFGDRLDRSKRMSTVRKPQAPALGDAERAFAADVLAGLAADPKQLPPKYFYDRRGSELFERITTLPEYYPTRIEIGILEAHAGAIAKLMPADAAVVEFGAGSAAKTRILLHAAPQVSAYVPVDISGEFLESGVARLRQHLPQLNVFPVDADFTRPFVLPAALGARPRVGFFPGSTIGNFEPHEANTLLRHAAAMLGPGALFIVGGDLINATDL